MRVFTKKLFLVPALITGIVLLQAGRLTAQTFTTLHSFTAGSGSYPNITNSDGANPYAGLILLDNTLYGTAFTGGSSGRGTVFAINTDGSGFANLYSFSALSVVSAGTNTDGANPNAGLILSTNTLYGTAFEGGFSDYGTVFALNTNSTGFANLYNFSDSGAYPNGLILSDNTLYGTTQEGTSAGGGTVFKLNTDGTGFMNLHTFSLAAGPNYTNSDGSNPYAGLLLSGNTLYGTAIGGGSSGRGTVFAVTTDGTVFTTLHSFAGSPSEGANPQGVLVLSGNTLYGTTVSGGSGLYGTVFAVNTDGTGFTNLYNFSGSNGGASPYAGLILSGSTLYGTASGGGGSSDNGTVFALNTDGTGFTNLYSFTALSNHTNSDGASPYAGLLLLSNTLYGTAVNGGSSGSGTVFALGLVPSLGIVPAGNQVVLSWPTWAPHFRLQTTTNLASPGWTTNSTPPVVVNGQNTVTTPISGTQQFFRLSQ